jgi:hypothetical protein
VFTRQLFSEFPQHIFPKQNLTHIANSKHLNKTFTMSNNIKIAYFLQPLIGVDGKEYVSFEKNWFDINQKEVESCFTETL